MQEIRRDFQAEAERKEFEAELKRKEKEKAMSREQQEYGKKNIISFVCLLEKEISREKSKNIVAKTTISFVCLFIRLFIYLFVC